MSDYQVIARKFRPQSFKDVIGQHPVITTLKNAIKFNRVAQAYLFCGSRGTGKTTLARLLAKALNCQQLTSDFEPCNQCSSCREIAACASLDVLEIDGASHRGIEDIRQINENVGYATSSGGYKIYIIDEVHMLTKEAFNALLKTLEEPPAKVKFLFATTEPHKIPPTILSRCQRFNLNRISQSQIVDKLKLIAHQLGLQVEDEALRLLAQRAEGGLRDAESLFDQVLAFEEGPITAKTLTTALGLMPREIYFEIDRAGKAGQFAKAFEIVHQIFSEGKDPLNFIEGLIDHLRQILMVKISANDLTGTFLTEAEKQQYLNNALLYTQEQCLDLIEYLLEAQTQLRLTAFSKISLEAILLHVMRSHFRLSIEQLVRHLSELEQVINGKGNLPSPVALPQEVSKVSTSTTKPSPLSTKPEIEPARTPTPSVPTPLIAPKNSLEKTSSTPLAPLFKTQQENPLPKVPKQTNLFVNEDPTPTPSDLGKKPSPVKSEASPATKKPSTTSSSHLPIQEDLKRPLYEYDTLLHFAAVELEGRLQKNQG